MAEVEDYADFGSHFLDSLLEVQMTVEDGELEVPPPKEDEPEDNPYMEFPPIPTFDLQSDFFRNPMAVTPPMQPAPMLTIHSKDIMSPNVLPPPPLITSGNYMATTMAPQILTSSVQQIISRPILKTVLSSSPRILSTTSLAKDTFSDANAKTEFVNKLFRNDYVKVFIKGDPPRNISAFQNDEMEYYNNHFRNLENIRHCKLHCTICDKHLGCGVDVENKAMVHSYLKVLTCKACFEFYGDGNFPCDAVDNCEIYCRWCGQGGALVCCSFCPRVFCKKCVRRNYGNAFLRSVERANDWACFCCSQKPLWPHRAICRALMEYITTRKKTPNNSLQRKDISSCCEFLKKKPQQQQQQQQQLQHQQQTQSQQPLTPQQQQIQHMQQLQLRKKDSSSPQSITLASQKNNPIQIIGDATKKLVLPISKTINNNFKNSLSQFKMSDQNKSPIRIVKAVGGGSNLKNNILRNYNSLPIAKVFSPSSIQSPVLHGQTVITPPASRQPAMIRPKPPQPAQQHPRPGPASRTQTQTQTQTQTGQQQKSPYVMVSLSNQSNPVDLSKIPTAKIPHNVQGLILRMNFPDNKVQLVRLVTEGNGCKAGKTFPMPEFKKTKETDFLENHLENSFKLSKILFDRLMLIKDKISSKNKNTEGSIYSSSVKKLHVIYEKTSELLKELDSELLKQFEDWKKAKEGGVVDVIDLSDEENKTPKKTNTNSNFDEITKELLMENVDSDVEIIDEEKTRGGNLENGEKTEDEETRSQEDFVDLKDKYNLKELSVNVVRLPVKRRRESEEEEEEDEEEDESKKSKLSEEEDKDAYDAKTDDEDDGKPETEVGASELSESAGRDENQICENGEITEEEMEEQNVPSEEDSSKNEDVPTTEDSSKNEEEHVPTEDEHVPMEDEHVPMEDEHVPMEEEHVPTEEQVPNDEIDTIIPSEDPSKTDDTNHVPSEDVRNENENNAGENEVSCQE